MQELRIVFDTAEAEAQMTELTTLLREVFVDHLPDDIIGEISKLSLDISIVDRSTTFSADGIMEHRLLIRFGSRFHDFMSAFRAGKLGGLAHNDAPIPRDS
jgi:hypothetical protein